jgi:deoxyadenosine/deoxycytidine kinase
MKMGEIEWRDYLAWFDWLTESFNVKPTGYIYLRADPATSHARVKARSRGGEDAIPLEYLEALHRKHDDWLLNESNVLVIDVNEDFEHDEDKLADMFQRVMKFIKR